MRALYAIKHKPSGFYLPPPLGRMGRGGSHTEPVDCSGDRPNPRLFETKLSADRALSAWLQGKWHIDRYGSGEDYEESLPYPKFIATRVREHMEVVPFNLTTTRP